MSNTMDESLRLFQAERIALYQANHITTLEAKLNKALQKVSAVHGFAVEGDLDRVLTMANAAGAEYGGSDAAASETWWSVILNEWAIYTGDTAREASNNE